MVLRNCGEKKEEAGELSPPGLMKIHPRGGTSGHGRTAALIAVITLPLLARVRSHDGDPQAVLDVNESSP
jgi:hypothetical protein